MIECFLGGMMFPIFCFIGDIYNVSYTYLCFISHVKAHDYET